MFQELSLRAKIGQMIVVRTTGYLFDHQIRYPVWEATNSQLTYWLKELNIGGVILLGGSAAEISLRTQQLQELAQIPLLICADVEEGVGQRFAGATWFPPPMTLSKIAETNLDLACEYAFTMGKITAAESLAIGINWILAPLVDVNNNPNNPVINLRSFGDRPEIVSQLATSFIKGTQSYPILTTAKHFPGHGDTSTDSHLELPLIKHSRERLEQIELPPFQTAIQAEVDSVMTAHLLVQAYDKDNPATLSHSILTGLLRNQLGFEGLIVTDALIMGGVAKYATPSEIAVKAILAGADILLMPSDPEEVINSVEEAVKTGKLSPERIDYSLARIAKAKQKIFSNSEGDCRTVTRNDIPNLKIDNSEGDCFAVTRNDIPNLKIDNSEGDCRAVTRNDITNLKVGKPEYFAQVDSILELTTQQGGNLPCISRSTLQTQRDFLLGSSIPPQDRNLILVDDLLSCDFFDRQSPCVTIPQQFGYQKQLLDFPNFYLATFDERPTLLQVFVRGNPFRGTAGLSEQSKQIYQRLISSGIVQGLIVYGSPYVKDWLLSVLPPSTPWVFSFAQHSPAQRIVCQRLFSLSRFDNVTDGNFI